MRNLTEIVVIADVSGSREPFKHEARTGINQFIRDQKAEPGEANLSLVFFSAPILDAYGKSVSGDNWLYKSSWRKPIHEVYEISEDAYNPKGMTALNDAINTCIDDLGKELDRMPEHDRPYKVIIAIDTDGLENSSKMTTHQIKAKLEHQQSVYSWKVIYLGQHLDAQQTAQNYGVADALQFAAGAVGTQAVYRSLSHAVSDYRAGNELHFNASIPDPSFAPEVK